jgi:putative component of membrane protein insertase Oxa1/YidC/SpoIIIJ protein YidD
MKSKKLAYLFVMVLLTFCKVSMAQTVSNVASSDPIQQAVHKNTVAIKSDTRKIARTKLLRLPLAITLYFYQNVLSEAFQTSCPHYPSCSGFAKDALTHFHLVKALALSADRLSRCTPMGINDYEENELNYFEDLILDSVNDY